MSKVYAQTAHNLGALNGIGPLGTIDPSGAGEMFEKVMSGLIGILTIIAALYFTFLFIIGAIQWLGSEGDKARLTTARGKITHGIIGLIIVIGAVFFIELIGTLLGIEILHPARFVKEIWS